MEHVVGRIERLRQVWMAGNTSLILGVFTATLFLSAALLFSVQPMFAKMVLPKLGGSPSVWAVSMCFFQAVLLAGYCYAHLLSRYVPRRLVPVAHLAVLFAAMLALPIGLSEGRTEPPAGDAYGWLIVTLSLGVGLPFFAVSANAPLLQAWFARTGHPHAGDPYFLYGASNLGSLVALLAYPIAIEPFSGLADQAALWAAGFLALAAMIALCAAMMIASIGADDADGRAETTAAASHLDAGHPTMAQRASWVALAFVPSGLLVAFTTYVTTDIASAPFLWVLPLATFLGTFILVFRDKPYIPHSWMLILQPIATVLVLLGISLTENRGWLIALWGGAIAFFVATMVCHRELFERRPASRFLTEFYLWMSLGGVLGGVFAALVAPQIFTATWEYPLLLVLAMACRPRIAAHMTRLELRQLTLIVSLAVAAMLLIALLQGNGLPTAQAEMLGVVILIGFGSLCILNRGRTLHQFAFTAIAALAIVILPSQMNQGDSERSFFGTHRVVMSPDGKIRLLLHGTTIHGAERLVQKDGSPSARPIPATYYHSESPLVLAVDAARETHRGPAPFRGGVVGLGAGAMACTSREGEEWRFYEIDPVVVKIATDPKRFRFMSVCQPNADIVIGDARLTLTKEPDGKFHFLHLDAFSSDAIPVHLMTVEAVRLYLEKLAPNGILMLHISNRHLDLVPVVTAVANAIPGTHLAHVFQDLREQDLDRVGSEVMYIAKSEAALAPVLRLTGARMVRSPAGAPWTDDYSDILTSLWRRYWRR